MVSTEAPTRRCQNSQMKDLVVFEIHCRYFAMFFLEVIQVHILSFALFSNLTVLSSYFPFLFLEEGNEGEQSYWLRSAKAVIFTVKC